MLQKRILAIDMGASSGRAMAGLYDGERLSLDELHRFGIRAVEVRGTLYHDVLRFFEEIKTGIGLAASSGGFESMGIDTWGCDFGLLDRAGKLVSNPVHYRDDRTIAAIEAFFKAHSRRELYELTGLQHLRFNTIFQLCALRESPEILASSHKLLMMPDLLTYFLTGSMACEYSAASTTQLVDPRAKTWSEAVLKKAGLERGLLCDIVPSGTPAGMLSDDICRELDIPPARVLYTAGHDTAAAFAAVPGGEDSVYISSGTWSLMGICNPEPIINGLSYKYNFANEGAADGGFRFLKNITGLWLVQECRREWGSPSYAELEDGAAGAGQFACFIDPDDELFMLPGDMPRKIQDFCRDSGQYVPRTRGEIMRCVYESLAMRYREVFGQISEASGRSFGRINIVGGGSLAVTLAGFTANACGVPVTAGPQEATAIGNIAVQLVSLGELASLNEAKQLISRSFETWEYVPQNTAEWDAAYEKFAGVTEK